MEQHAVPQDITGFKFKLVGDMTLKQFGELAFGAIMAYLFYASNWHPLLKWPLALGFALLGIALAFIPIEERPLDIWIFNFFKAIYHPTYFVWKKSANLSLETPPAVSKSTPLPPPPSPVATTPVLAPEPEAPEENSQLSETPPSSPPTPGTSTLPTIDDLLKTPVQPPPPSVAPETPPPPKQPASPTIEELLKLRTTKQKSLGQDNTSQLSASEKKLQGLTQKFKDISIRMDEIRNQIILHPTQNNSALEKQLEPLLAQKNQLQSEITAARDQLITARVAPLTQETYKEPLFVKPPQKSKSDSKTALISLTTIPNIVNGVVLDSESKPLNSVILIIKDHDGNSIRALKTNRVGQFIASTPLGSGTYFLELEKPDYHFDTFEIKLTGKIEDPIEIKAK